MYEFTVTLNKEQVRGFYQTMSNALKHWPGGDPGEQELLYLMRDHAYRMVLESQFKG